MDSQQKKTLMYAGAGFLLGIGLMKLLEHLKPKKTDIRFSTKVTTENINSPEYHKIVTEQLVRNIQFFGEEGQQKIENSFIIVVGVGGVGSHVLSAIVRSGVKKIRVIDFDRITLSSLNRHAFATREDVGIAKVACCEKFVKKIFPHVHIEFIETFLSEKNVELLLGGAPTYVIDCIDNIEAKVDLVAYCVKQGIKIIAACGAGCKADPTQLQIRDISDSAYDDLSRALRTKLKKKGVTTGVKCVFSVERTERELLPLKEFQKNDPDQYRLLPNYRVRIIPVFSAMPALMGMSIASYVLCDIAGQTYKQFQNKKFNFVHRPHNLDEVKSNNYQKLLQLLINKEKKKGIKEEDIEFDIEDTYILAREIFDWCCVVTGKKYHGLEFIQWDPKKKLTVRNVVLMTGELARKHAEYDSIDGKYSAEIYQKVKDAHEKLEIRLKQKIPIYTH